ncbi:Uncharacterised protein [Shewanella putrefaciens]|nr:Uncharacterised protein [Shewanella putrefaciens]
MMWNWFSKMLGRHEQPKRKKVQVEIPFEQHRFSMDNGMDPSTLNRPRNGPRCSR